MSHLTTAIRALTVRSHRDEEGAGMVEYALLIVFVAIVAIVGLNTLGGGLNSVFGGIGDSVSDAPTSIPTPGGE